MSKSLAPVPLTQDRMKEAIYKKLRAMIPATDFLDDKFLSGKDVAAALDSIGDRTNPPKLKYLLNTQLERLRQVYLNRHLVIGRLGDKKTNDAFDDAFAQLVDDFKKRYLERASFLRAIDHEAIKSLDQYGVIKSSIAALSSDATLESGNPTSIGAGAMARIMINYAIDPQAFSLSLDSENRNFIELLSGYDSKVASKIEVLVRKINELNANRDHIDDSNRICYILDSVMRNNDGNIDNKANKIINNLSENILAGVITEGEILKMLDGVEGELTTEVLHNLFGSKQQFYDHKRENGSVIRDIFKAKQQLLDFKDGTPDLSEQEKKFIELVISFKTTLSDNFAGGTNIGAYDAERALLMLYDNVDDITSDHLPDSLTKASAWEFGFYRDVIQFIKSKGREGGLASNIPVDAVSRINKLLNVTDEDQKKYLTIFYMVAQRTVMARKAKDQLDYLITSLKDGKIKTSDLVAAIKDDNIKGFLEQQEKESKKWGWRRKKSDRDDEAKTKLDDESKRIPPQERPSITKFEKDERELRRQHLTGGRLEAKKLPLENAPKDVVMARTILSGGVSRPIEEDKFLEEFVRAFKSTNITADKVSLFDVGSDDEIEKNLLQGRWSIILIPGKDGNKKCGYIIISPDNDIIPVKSKGDSNFNVKAALKKYVPAGFQDFEPPKEIKFHPAVKLTSKKYGYDQIKSHCNSLVNVLSGIDALKPATTKTDRKKHIKTIIKAAKEGKKGYDDVDGHLSKKAYGASLKDKFELELGATFAALIKENPELKGVLEITPLDSTAIANNISRKVWSIVPSCVLDTDLTYTIVSPEGKALYVETGGVSRVGFDRVFKEALKMTSPQIAYEESNVKRVLIGGKKNTEVQNARFCHSLASFMRKFSDEVKKKDKSSVGLPIASDNTSALTLGNQKLILSLVDGKGIVNQVVLKALKAAVVDMASEFDAAPKVSALLSNIENETPQRRVQLTNQIATYCSQYVNMGIIHRNRYDFPIARFKDAVQRDRKNYGERDFMPPFDARTDLLQDEIISDVMSEHLFPDKSHSQIIGLKRQIEDLAEIAKKNKRIKVPKSFGFIGNEVLVTQDDNGVKLEYHVMEPIPGSPGRAKNTLHSVQIRKDGQILKDEKFVTSVKDHMAVVDFLMETVGNKKSKEDDKKKRLDGRESYEGKAVEDIVRMSFFINNLADKKSFDEVRGAIFPAMGPLKGKAGLKINIGDLEITKATDKEATYKKEKGGDRDRLKFILDCRAKYQEVLRLEVIKKLEALDGMGFYKQVYKIERGDGKITAFSVVQGTSKLSAIDDADTSLLIEHAKKLDKCVKVMDVFNTIIRINSVFKDGEIINIDRTDRGDTNLAGRYQIFKNGIFKINPNGKLTEVKDEIIDRLKAKIDTCQGYNFCGSNLAPSPVPVPTPAVASVAARSVGAGHHNPSAAPLPSAAMSGGPSAAPIASAAARGNPTAQPIPSADMRGAPSAAASPPSVFNLDALRSRGDGPAAIPADAPAVKKKSARRAVKTDEQIKRKIIANIISYINESKKGSREEITGSMFDGWPERDKKYLPILRDADFLGNNVIENTRYLHIAGVHLVGFRFGNNHGLSLRNCVLEDCVVDKKNTSIAKGGHGKIEYVVEGSPSTSIIPTKVQQLMTTQQQKAVAAPTH